MADTELSAIKYAFNHSSRAAAGILPYSVADASLWLGALSVSNWNPQIFIAHAE